MKLSVITLLVLSFAFLVACEDDKDPVDITAPTIELEEPEYGEAFPAGGEIHFDAMFEDDEELATYSIEIHENFDGHAHGRREWAPFEYNESFEISGTQADEHFEIDITTDATAGPYHFIVEAIDAAGNATSFADGSSQEIEIWITNEEMAHIHFEDANGEEVEEYEGTVDVALEFFGEIEVETGALDHILIIVGHLEEGGGDHGHDHGRIEEDEIFEEEYEVEGEVTVYIQDLLANESIVVTQADLDELEEDEHLYLIVIAQTENENISRNVIEIHFD